MEKRRLYAYNQVNLEGGVRLDSCEHTGKPERISRKETDFMSVSDTEFEKYVYKIDKKYPVGKKIRSNRCRELDGQVLRGDAVLEVPLENLDPKDPAVVNNPAKRAELEARRNRFEAIAAQAGVEIRYTAE